jgi:mono/diheme cytochrome c family protein
MRDLFLLLNIGPVLAAQQADTKQPAPPAQTEQAKIRNPGQKIFEDHCMRCHGTDGSSNTFIGHKWNIPDLRSDAVQKLSAEQRIIIITGGKNNMPAHKDKVTKDEIRLVESYVRDLGKKQAPATSTSGVVGSSAK